MPAMQVIFFCRKIPLNSYKSNCVEVVTSSSDFELLALIKEGDKNAYTQIYQRYFRPLFAHVYKKLGNEAEAKDIIQELFTTLWVKRESLDPQNSVAAYLFTAARNRVLDLWSHQQVESRYIDSLQNYLDNAPETADFLVREKQLMEMIETEIQALPPKMREVFELSRKQNLSHKEIAGKLGIAEQTVAKQISNALRILKIKLGSLLFLYFLIHW
jgi:RNA polymerase sigma-70 factor (family 1)